MNMCSPRYLTTWHIKQIPIAGPAHHSPNAQTSASQTQLPAPSTQQYPDCHTTCLIPHLPPTQPSSSMMQPQALAVPTLRVRACPLRLAADPAELQSVMLLQLPDYASAPVKGQNRCYQEAKQLHSPSRTIPNPIAPTITTDPPCCFRHVLWLCFITTCHSSPHRWSGLLRHPVNSSLWQMVLLRATPAQTLQCWKRLSICLGIKRYTGQTERRNKQSSLT